MDEATLKQPVPPAPGARAASGSVCSTAGCSLVLPQDVSVLRQPTARLLPLDVSILQQPFWTCLSYSIMCTIVQLSTSLFCAASRRVSCKAACTASGRVCSRATCAASIRTCSKASLCRFWTFYFGVLYSPGLICSTADSAAWICLFSVPQHPMLPLDLSVLQQYVQSLGVFVLKQPFLPLDASVTACAARASVEHQPLLSPEVTGRRKVLHLDLSVHKRLCCIFWDAPGRVCVQELMLLVLHLYVCCCAAPWRKSLCCTCCTFLSIKALCCSWTCMPTRLQEPVLHLEVYDAQCTIQ